MENPPALEPKQDPLRGGTYRMKQWKKQMKYTTWGSSDRFPYLPSSVPLSKAQWGKVHSLHSTPWGLGLVTYTLLHPMEYTPPYVFLLCSMALNYGHSPRPPNNSPPEPNWLPLHLIIHLPKTAGFHKQILMQRESLLPGKTSLINSVSPPIQQLFKTLLSKESWWHSIKCLLDIQACITIQHWCDNYPLDECTLPIGRPAPHWTITLKDTYATHRNNFRSRVWCGWRWMPAVSDLETTGPNQTIPSASSATLSPKTTSTSLPNPRRSHLFDSASWAKSIGYSITPSTEVMLGLELIMDTLTQTFTIIFLTELKDYHNSLILQLIWALKNGHIKFAQTGILSLSRGYEKEDRYITVAVTKYPFYSLAMHEN